MTIATFNYIAARYEAAVDIGLNVHTIRLRLAKHGKAAGIFLANKSLDGFRASVIARYSVD